MMNSSEAILEQTLEEEALLESFLNKIDNELILRKKQLGFIHEILNQLSSNNHKFTFIRITIPEIYAHYEGFLKFIFLELTHYIKSIHVPNADIKINYLILTLLTHLEEHIVSQKTKANKIIDIFNKTFKEDYNFLSIANLDKYIVNHDTLVNTLKILDIENPDTILPLNKLGILYERRNQIAHGQLYTGNPFSISRNRDISDQQVTITYGIWQEDYRCVLSSLDVIKDIVTNYIINNEYSSI